MREKVEREGVDVVLVLDTSGSMATADVAPSRFFLARQALLQLVARLEGDRFALVAFEGEAYPLVPLTLDADALGLFLETVEPGIVPAPGTSLGVGLAKGLEAFVDKERRNKVMVLVSDGEDLEGEVEEAVRRAKEAGVVVHAVGVGTEAGQPVPDVDADGRVTGYKRDEGGGAVVSRLNMSTLDAIARGTGGQAFRITPADTSLRSTRGRDRGHGAEGARPRVLLPPQGALPGAARLRPRRAWPSASCCPAAPPAAAARHGRGGLPQGGDAAAGLRPSLRPAEPGPGRRRGPASPAPARAAAEPARRSGTVLDELLLRPRRATEEGRGEYARGSHPQALSAFERAAAARPQDPAVRFNVADGLYKNGKYDEAAAVFRALGADAALEGGGGLALQPRQQPLPEAGLPGSHPGVPRRAARGARATRTRAATSSWRSARSRSRRSSRSGSSSRTRRTSRKTRSSSRRTEKGQQDQKQQQRPAGPGQEAATAAGPQSQPRPQTPQERADQRFQQEAGMPQERAMQLLDALQQNEKAEQKKLLALKRAQKKKGKDW